jgi:c-di-GMP-binding flagellar brake protein YcgR
MAVPFERRQAPRVALIGRPGARVQDTLVAWLADLSTTGARVTLTEQLHPPISLTLDVAPGLGGCRLAARVIWTATYGSEQALEGERHALYQSGLAFVGVTPEQQETLDRLVDRFRRERASRGRGESPPGWTGYRRPRKKP